MVLALRLLVYEIALVVVYALLPLWFALGPGARLGILIESLQLPGFILALLGAALWLEATVVLVTRGGGMPLLLLSPPARLVVEGPYAWVRHPMHVGLVVFLLGWALLFRSPVLLGWALVVAGLVWAYARWLEEPALERRFGDAYRIYRARVPAWWPRRTAHPRRPRWLPPRSAP